MGLTGADFTVTEGVTGRPISTANYVETVYEKIAIAAAMDYSGSIPSESLLEIQSGLISLFDNLRATDMGEVIKFGTGVEVTQPFTSDKIALSTAVLAPFTNNNDTNLYDAAFKAVDDTSAMTDYRRAVIVLSDGYDYFSTHSLNDVINNAIAKKVPIFTVGINNSNRAVLEQMADDTGGQFFESKTTQNLATIYQQLSSILYEKQYILTFDQLPLGVPGGATANLNIGVNSNGVIGDDSRLITSCD